MVLVHCKEVSHRTPAEKLKGMSLWVHKSKLPPIVETDTYYQHDLVGLPVMDQDGEPIGHVVGVHNFGAGDIIEVNLQGQKQTVMLPFDRHCIQSVQLRPASASTDENPAVTQRGLVLDKGYLQDLLTLDET